MPHATTDLQGGSSTDTHYKYRTDNPKELERIRPLLWPEHLRSPLSEAGKENIIQYLKGNNPSVWRVLVEPSKEESFITTVVTDDFDGITSAFSHRNVKGVVYAVGSDPYDVDDFLHRGRNQGLMLSKAGSIIKELLTTTEAYLLLSKEAGPVVPDEGSFVRLLSSSNYPNALAYVFKREFETQVIHLLVLPVRVHYTRGPGAEIRMSSTPYIEKREGNLAHDFRKTAYGMIRGQTVFDCIQPQNICPSKNEIEALEECNFDPVREAIQSLRRGVISKGDRVRVIAGEYMGLLGWAAGPMTTDTVEVMPMTPILNHDIVGIEILCKDLNRFDFREGDKVMAIRGPFCGVTVEVVAYVDDDTIHAQIVTPTLLEPRAKVYNHEIIRVVEIGDYIEVIHGPYVGCMGYATEDRWQSCYIYVDASRKIDNDEYRLTALMQTWIDVDYHNLRVVRPFRPQAPSERRKKAIDDEDALDDPSAAQFKGMAVYIVYHRHLKGSIGTIVESFISRTKDGQETRRFNVLPDHSISSYTYTMREWELLEASVAARHSMAQLVSDTVRPATPDFDSSTDPMPTGGDTFGGSHDADSSFDPTEGETKRRAIQAMASDGRWLLDRRLLHQKLEIEISGTKGSQVFRKGIYEGCKGYTIITSPIRSADCDIFVRIDSMDSSPTTRIPIKYIWPKNSTFPIGWRVVVKGATLEGDETYIGSYALIVPSVYELEYLVRLVFVIPSGPYEYFDISSLCSSGETSEWFGYKY